jgi:predicted small secreted protein
MGNEWAGGLAMSALSAACNGQWGAGEDKTWNVVAGLSLTATF